MSSADENELIQGLVDMAEAYWDERTALRARVAELEAFEAAAKARMVEYAKTNAEMADWVIELQAERDKLAAVVERVRELANVRGGYSAAYDLALDILAELPPKEDP